MKASQFFISTLKEAPADAEIVSHKLMMRAGMIKKLGAGLYTYMPVGLRVIRKVEQIVREEMNAAGAVEVLMPVVQPGELWQETGRWDKMGDELLRFKDRHERDFVMQPTSEEVVTDIARTEIRSYKQLPVNFYQIQTKFRDERRPRFGIMRGREFTMKDAYSFDRDAEGLKLSYQKMYDAYTRIFQRFGLEFRAVAIGVAHHVVLADRHRFRIDRKAQRRFITPAHIERHGITIDRRGRESHGVFREGLVDERVHQQLVFEVAGAVMATCRQRQRSRQRERHESAARSTCRHQIHELSLGDVSSGLGEEGAGADTLTVSTMTVVVVTARAGWAYCSFRPPWPPDRSRLSRPSRPSRSRCWPPRP